MLSLNLDALRGDLPQIIDHNEINFACYSTYTSAAFKRFCLRFLNRNISARASKISSITHGRHRTSFSGPITEFRNS